MTTTSPSSPSSRPSTGGLVQYYLPAQDVFRLGKLRWVMETSLLKTLAGAGDSGAQDRRRSTTTATLRSPLRPASAKALASRPPDQRPIARRSRAAPLAILARREEDAVALATDLR